MDNSETFSQSLEANDPLRGEISGAITSQPTAAQSAAPEFEAIVEVGSDQSETIVGTPDNDTLRGEGGRDRLLGRSGDDLLDGGKGGDTLLGEAGDDRLFGRAGADELRGGGCEDTLNGGGAADELFGGAGADRLVGGGGRDKMIGGGGADTMLGGGGGDEMTGNGGGDLMRGGGGADSMSGKAGRDRIDGDNGADAIFGGGGADELNGDRGRDQIEGGRGRDAIFGGDGDDAVSGDEGDDLLSGDDGDDSVDGGAGDDMLSGDNGEDVLRGGDGDDTLIGNKGDDQVFGEDGDDLLVWNNGDGSDLLNGGDGDDTVQVNFDTDLVNDDLQNADVARITANGENLLFERTAVNGQSEFGLFALDVQETETLDVNFGGGDDAAVLEDVRATGVAVDLDGSDGIDTLDLSALGDGVTAILEAGTVTDTATGDVLATFESFENVTGTIANDALTGDDGVNAIDSGDGDDEVSGGSENDVLNGGDGDDTLIGNKGDDQVFGEDGDDLLVWNNGDGSDLLNGGDGDDTVQVNFDTDLVNDDLQNADVARVSANGENVLFERTAVNGQSEFGLFALDVQETETLDVNFGGGDDAAVLEDVRATGVAVDLNGGDGIDTLDLSALGDGVTVDLEAGTVTDTATGDVLATFENFESVIGTIANDTLTGDDGVNAIDSGDGDDEVSGGGENDVLNGGDGDDTLVGNKGDDQVFGEDGDDMLVWNNGDGSDLLNGGDGDDTVQVNFDTDLVNTELQNADVARISANGENVLFERIELNGQTEAGLFALDVQETETLEVNFAGGNDTAVLEDVRATGIAVDLDGGDGVDTLDLSAFGDGVTVDVEAGTVIDSATEKVVATFDNFENVIGTHANDALTGDNGVNVLNGGTGDDTLVGNKGDDQVFGEDGDDMLVWNNGDGSDLLNGGDGDDTVQVNFNTDQGSSDPQNESSEGDDPLGSNSPGESTTGGGLVADEGTIDIPGLGDVDEGDVESDQQNADVARISANGENLLFERIELNGQTEAGLFALDIQETEMLDVNFGGGDDTAVLEDLRATGVAVDLDGGVGFDTLDLSALGDGVTVDLEAGTVTDTATADVLATFENFENVIGGSGGDSIEGDAAANDLSGGDGADQLEGGQGEDTIQGGSGNDTLNGGGQESVEWVETPAGGSENDELTGGEGADTFVFADEGAGVGPDDWIEKKADPSFGDDTITDFTAQGPSADLIDLSGFSFGSNTLEDLFSNELIVQDGVDTVIFVSPGSSITLLNVDNEDLSEANFLFSELDQLL